MRILNIDEDNSVIRILVYKIGVLSRLSHNKVIVTEEVSGNIRFDLENIGSSSVLLTIPCLSFFVGGREYRRREGRDFSRHINEADKRKITEIMLSADVLDIDSYPHITVKSKEITGTYSNVILKADICLHGISKEVEFEAKVSESDKSLKVTGRFYLKQTDFGIIPVNILCGMIRIRDEIVVKFDLNAR